MILRVLIALALVIVIVGFVYRSMRSYARGVSASDEAPPQTLFVPDADIRFRCAKCGLELLVVELPELGPKNEMGALRHCREEMRLVSDIPT